MRAAGQCALCRGRHRIHAGADLLAAALPHPNRRRRHRGADRLSRARPRPHPLLRADGQRARAKGVSLGTAGREIVHHLARVIPHPIFDTQVAAMVCGFGEAVSYSMLVKRLLNRNLDKTSRFTDWSRRPLSERQLTYAIGDVVHLRDLYPKLRAQLDKSERASWLNEEMGVLTDPATYELHPEQAWRRLKMRIKTPKALAVLMELAAWREREAQSQDVPRARILKDEALYDIASQAPRTVEDLGSLRTLHNGFARSMRGRAVLEAVVKGLDRDPKTIPPIERGEPMPPEAQAVVDLLRVLLKATAGRHGEQGRRSGRRCPSSSLSAFPAASDPHPHCGANVGREVFERFEQPHE